LLENVDISAFSVLQLFLPKALEDHVISYSVASGKSQNKSSISSSDEFWKYIIVSTGIGLVKLPKSRDHWKKDEDGLYGTKFFSSILSRKKFEDYRSTLSYNYDFMENHLNWSFQRLWNPRHVCVVDECMILFKGRFSGRQHVRGKPQATGLKYYALCDMSGYCYSFWLYKGAGKNPTKSAKQSDLCPDLAADLLKGESPEPIAPIVGSSPVQSETIDPRIDVLLNSDGTREEVDLSQVNPEGDPDTLGKSYIYNTPLDLPENPFCSDGFTPPGATDFVLDGGQIQKRTIGKSGYCIIADSYFGSLEAAAKLNPNFFFILAVKKNVDTTVKGPLTYGLKKDNWRSLYNDKEHITYCTFHDRAVCSFLSNFRDGSKHVIRNTNSKSQEIPNIVSFYNQYINAIDIFDSHLHLYLNTHRNQKWTQCAFNALIKMAITNAWILYCNLTKSTVTNAEFLELFLREGLAKFKSKTSSPKAKRHVIMEAETISRCCVCNCPGGTRSYTPFYCPSCNLYLHPKCFAGYHEEL